MPIDTSKRNNSKKSQAFKSAVKKLIQVPRQELKEKLAEAELKKGDRPSEPSPDEGDRSLATLPWATLKFSIA